MKGDFVKRRALMLPEVARYDDLLKLPSGTNLGAAMNAIEAEFAPLAGQLPKDYDRFENKLLKTCCAAATPRRCAMRLATCLAASTNTF